MSLKLKSYSSSLMHGTTLYRNQSGVINKIFAQAGYALISLAAAIETIAATIFCFISLVCFPFSSKPLEYGKKWIKSSAFSIGWSLIDFFLNPFAVKLVSEEKMARRVLKSGNIFQIPRSAM
jgi:hypothetical protein